MNNLIYTYTQEQIMAWLLERAQHAHREGHVYDEHMIKSLRDAMKRDMQAGRIEPTLSNKATS